jgi:hypothetical protein
MEVNRDEAIEAMWSASVCKYRDARQQELWEAWTAFHQAARHRRILERLS